ncbi:hypothetical protein GGR55DRAFT_682902 [Xylaria sp. FL0064]|nr:hypothetical protein GGR55DRAFT_682902 [Xylaria sp. FL0064]
MFEQPELEHPADSRTRTVDAREVPDEPVNSSSRNRYSLKLEVARNPAIGSLELFKAVNKIGHDIFDASTLLKAKLSDW